MFQTKKFILAFFSSCVRASVLVTADEFVTVLNTSSATPVWYINDHTLVAGPGGVWHAFGITHTEPADPIFEVNFAHAISRTANASVAKFEGFTLVPFALGSVLPETHLWAPHVIALQAEKEIDVSGSSGFMSSRSDSVSYKMVYCGGGNDRTNYELSLASSTDLFTWTREGVMFTDGIDGRDPMLLNLGSKFNNSWVVYYTGTDPNSLDDCSKSQHVTFLRQALDESLLKWSEKKVVFVGGSDGSCAGGPTESPFVVRRGDSFYLFSGSWNTYSDTRVFLSTDPFDFGSVPQGTAQQVGEIPSHAPEVVRDWKGNYYVSRAGWGQGGLFLSLLTWHDGLDSLPSSLPVPTYSPALAVNFNTNLKDWVSVGGMWVVTSSGLYGADALSDAFYMSATQLASSSFTFDADITLLTKDGNPTSSPSQWTRQGSAAALVVCCQNQSNPLLGSYVVNLMATGDSTKGGLKIFAFPYRELVTVSLTISQGTVYHLRVAVNTTKLNTNIAAYLDEQLIADVVDSAFSRGSVGLNVWQTSSRFQNVIVSSSKQSSR